jgi:hypothetical protein
MQMYGCDSQMHNLYQITKVCFVCFYLPEQFFGSPAAVTIWTLAYHSWILAVKVLLLVTPAATQDLSFTFI